MRLRRRKREHLCLGFEKFGGRGLLLPERNTLRQTLEAEADRWSICSAVPGKNNVQSMRSRVAFLSDPPRSYLIRAVGHRAARVTPASRTAAWVRRPFACRTKTCVCTRASESSMVLVLLLWRCRRFH